METPRNGRNRKEHGFFNVSCISTSVFVAYVAYVVYNMHGVMNPLRHVVITPDTPTIKPLWSEGTKMTATCYLAASSRFHDNYRNRSHPSAARVPIVARAEGLTFDHGMTRHSFDLNISSHAATGVEEASPNITMLAGQDWRLLMSNKTLYFHVVVEADVAPVVKAEEELWTLVGSVPLVKFGPRPKVRPLRKLLGDLTGGGQINAGREEQDSNSAGVADVETRRSSASRLRTKGDYISFWKPEVAVRLVTDFTEYPLDFLPNTVQRAATILFLDKNGRWLPNGRGWEQVVYKPVLHADEIGLTSDKYVPLNDTLSSLPMKVTIEPMSFSRWQLMQVMEGSLQQQKESFGFQDSDVDDVRRLISDTNVYLVMVTLLASVLHLLFEFLAFKSDVDFWRKNKSLKGLSVRTLFMDVGFQTVILFSLIEEDASLLVTVPAGAGVLIQIWKVRRATGMQIGWKGVVFPRLAKAEDEDVNGGGQNKPSGLEPPLSAPTPTPSTSEETDVAADVDDSASRSGNQQGGARRRTKNGRGAKTATTKGKTDSSEGRGEGGTPRVGDADAVILPESDAAVVGAEQAMETMHYDRVAIGYLSLLLLPLVVGFSGKKLVMDEHAGWYSWALQSLTAFVYTFGFVLMTPQLYINYKLKSVAHLPWRFLCYRSLNTVIDDLFAFVIRMPAMHRLSCFRDDVVFVIYLYQRWIYPVDTNRPQDRG